MFIKKIMFMFMAINGRLWQNEILCKNLPHFVKKCRNCGKTNWLLHNENAPAYTAFAT